MKNKNNEIYQNYGKLNPTVKKFLHKIWQEKQINIWWVVNYQSNISNWIKLFSQSIYSHTNFFDWVNKWIWAEDLKWIQLVDYARFDLWNFYYITKTINFDYLSLIYSFEYITQIFIKLWKFWSNDKDRLKNKFCKYVQLKETKIIYKWNYETDLEDILSYDIDQIDIKQKITENIEKFLKIKNDIKYWISYEFDRAFYNKYLNYLKEFLLMWIIKFIIQNYGKEYDLQWTLSTLIVPWNMVDLSQKQYFCSEFVSESLIYAWIYPFDINTKDPSSITPWDIMDMTIIFQKDSTKLFEIDDTDKKQKIKLISYWTTDIIKNYILKHEKNKLYFIKQKMLVWATSNTIGFFTKKVTNQNNKKPGNVAFKYVFNTILFFVLFTYVIMIYKTWWNQASIFDWNSWDNSNILIWLLSLITQLLYTGMIIFIKIAFVVLSTYYIIFFIIPYINKFIQQIKELIKINQ